MRKCALALPLSIDQFTKEEMRKKHASLPMRIILAISSYAYYFETRQEPSRGTPRTPWRQKRIVFLIKSNAAFHKDFTFKLPIDDDDDDDDDVVLKIKKK